VAFRLLVSVRMKIAAAIAMSLAAFGCATDSSDEPFDFDQARPMQDGKGDAVGCGAGSCEPYLCDFDCTTAGQQCSKTCAAEDGRPNAFVAASVGGSSFDSRNNPYVPRLALDNVLVYGCNLWDFSSQAYDGLEISYKELIHSSFTVNKDDPTRTKANFGLYTKGFTGPGSYRAEAHYEASSDAQRYAAEDACSLDVADDGAGGIKGSFDCTISADGSGSVSVKGTFACPQAAVDEPVFSAWAAAPH
jgi:hypothetical protein